MSTETKTVKMGIAPGFARFIAGQVRDGNHAFVMGTTTDDRDEREETFRDMAVTYLIGQMLLDRDMAYADINDYAITLVEREDDDEA